MNNFTIIATTLTSGVSLKFLAGVGGIGWLLAVYCLWDKFDSKKDKVIHLVSDVINATFAVITLVAAVSIAINLSLWLPDRPAERTSPVPPASVTFADEITALSRNGTLNNTSLNEVLRRELKGLSYSDGSLYFRVDNRLISIERNFKGAVAH